MTKHYKEIIKELVEAVRDQADKNDVAFELFISGSEYRFTFRSRDSGSLKNEGVSMRNMAGDWIND